MVALIVLAGPPFLAAIMAGPAALGTAAFLSVVVASVSIERLRRGGETQGGADGAVSRTPSTPEPTERGGDRVAETRPSGRPPSRRRVTRLQDREVAQLAAALARSLRSGATVPGAIAEGVDTAAVASFRRDLTQVCEGWEKGTPIAEALRDWADRSPVDGVELITSALILGYRSGGDRARVLDAVATTLSDRQALSAEVAALTSQARASATLITVAPVVVAAVFLVMDPAVVQVMLERSIGRICLGLGLALAALDWWWMSRLVRQVLR